jgi:hypothetical protein
VSGCAWSSRTLEVGHFENIGAAFAGCRNDLWRVDFHKVLRCQKVAKQLAHAGLNAENALVRDGLHVNLRDKYRNTYAQINNAMVQTCVQQDAAELIFGFVFFFPTLRRIDREWQFFNGNFAFDVNLRVQSACGSVGDKRHLFNLQLQHADGARLDFLKGLDD